MSVKIRKNYDERVIVGLDCGKERVTKQCFKDECDINTIMKKYQHTGILPVNDESGMYGDFSNPVDYQESLNLVIQAEEQFANLPSDVRDRFQNNPHELLKFIHNEKNYEEGVKLGLFKEKEKDLINTDIKSEGEKK